MGTTVNLGLPTNNSTTDRQKKFLTYTMEQDGNVSSANTIIDAWAGTVNQKITALENNKPTILLKPQWISVGYYEVTTSEISEFKVDMLITVKLSKDNDGTLTMKVNELPIKSLLKYDTTGTLVNLSVGDLRKDREYQFRYDGTSFVWQGGTSADQLNIVGTVGNIVGIKSDNTVVDSGVSAAQVTTNKNNITSLQTNKIDKTQIKNTLTETTSGNVLDATQGKVLNDEIGLKLAKTDVINTTTQTTTGKALDATQNNDSIDGTLANKIKVLQTSDATQTQQINDLKTMKNKNVCVYGDSIAWGQKAPNGVRSENPWPKIFGEVTGANIVDNKAIPGTCLAIGNGYGITQEINNNAFCNRIDSEDFTGYDYLFLAYGTNDYGFVIEMGSNVEDKNTFKGSLHYSLKKLSTEHPTMKIVLLTTMYATTSLIYNQKGYTMLDYCNAIKDVANQYGCPVIDMHNGFGVNQYNIGSMYWDSLHPNDNTYIEMGKYIAYSVSAQSSIGVTDVKNMLPNIGTDNMLCSTDIIVQQSSNIFNNIDYENGTTFILTPNQLVQTDFIYSLQPNTTYTVTMAYKSIGNTNNQRVQVDFYGDNKIICYKIVSTQSVDKIIKFKLITPSNISTSLKYQLRFNAIDTNTTNVAISSIMLTNGDVSYNYSPKKNNKFNNITVTSPNTSGTYAPRYIKDAGEFIHLEGLVVVTGDTVITTLPYGYRPKYTITTSIMSTDGVFTYCIINKSGVVSVGSGNKTYDLSSIPSFYIGAL